MTVIQIAHGDLLARNDEQHKSMNATIKSLVDKIGMQNGRVTALEHFKTTIMTKIKVIPATISAIFGTATILIGMYLRTK